MNIYKITAYFEGTDEDAISLSEDFAQTVFDEWELASVFGVCVKLQEREPGKASGLYERVKNRKLRWEEATGSEGACYVLFDDDAGAVIARLYEGVIDGEPDFYMDLQQGSGILTFYQKHYATREDMLSGAKRTAALIDSLQRKQKG